MQRDDSLVLGHPDATKVANLDCEDFSFFFASAWHPNQGID